MNKTTATSTCAGYALLGVLSILAILLFVGAPDRGLADDTSDANALIDQAETTLKDFLNASDMKWFGDNLKNANGLYILPKQLKDAFIFALKAEVVSSSRAKGLFAGLSFEGAAIRTRDELNAVSKK